MIREFYISGNSLEQGEKESMAWSIVGTMQENGIYSKQAIDHSTVDIEDSLPVMDMGLYEGYLYQKAIEMLERASIKFVVEVKENIE